MVICGQKGCGILSFNYTCPRCKTLNENLGESNKHCSKCGVQLSFTWEEIQNKREKKLNNAVWVTCGYLIVSGICISAYIENWIPAFLSFAAMIYLWDAKHH